MSPFCEQNNASPGQESLPQRSNNNSDRSIATNGGVGEDRNGDRSSLTSTSSGSGGLGSPISLTSNTSSAPELNGALGMGASFLVVYHRKMVYKFSNGFQNFIKFYNYRFPISVQRSARISTLCLLTKRGLVSLGYLC